MYLLNHDDNQAHRRRCKIPFPSHVSCFLMISLQNMPVLLCYLPVFGTFTLELSYWTASSEFGTYRLCEQRRFRRAESSLLAHTSSESRGTFRQKARSLAPLKGWACAVKICHDGMLEDTNSLDGAQMILKRGQTVWLLFTSSPRHTDHLALHLQLGTFCVRHEMCIVGNAQKYS